jgi:NAD(P)-dependent dehydrogenase (short-subunit alcohol dehydrogenase family)
MTSVTSAFAVVEALGRSLALELGPIRVNTIRPGFIDTDFWTILSEAGAARVREKVRANVPMRRLGQPAHVGHAAVFLMTNPYVTGTVLDLTGGEPLVDWMVKKSSGAHFTARGQTESRCSGPPVSGR